MIPPALQRYVQSRQAPVCAYVYDLAHLRRRSQALRAQLPAACSLFYAVKANNERPILRTLLPIVDGFEVASLGEIERVRDISGTCPLLFGGPGKTDAELEGALTHGVALVHVESEHQLRRLNWLAGRRRRTAQILLRVNPAPTLTQAAAQAPLRMGGLPTQFGIAQDQVPALLDVVRRCRHVRLRGLHFHALSNQLDAQAHLALIARYMALAAAWQRECRLPLHWLNAGGGIGVDYAAQPRQFDWASFCQGLHVLLASAQASDLRLAFECGRFLVADCGYYLAEVTDLKTCFGEHFAILRGGSHHFRLPSAWQHDHPCEVIASEHWPYPWARPTLLDARITLCGELCTPKDVLARNVPLRRLRAGDCIVFVLAGAYGWHISHHDFLSHPHPARLYLDEPGAS
ncbi:MAG TPA: type III PLP-dependent enzyme [Stenotrophomonas sp.]|nr:type III PLP-dependent enzyme [Stenotrophomonas sp.]